LPSEQFVGAIEVPDFHTVADAVAARISAGKLTPGTRLPPQRSFAYQHGIAVSTASRVYAELVRRGLVVGEVGRGTFVRAPETLRAAASEAAGAPIDLQFAVALSLEQAALMTPALKALSGPAALYAALDAPGPFGPKRAGEIVANFLRHKPWTPDPTGILLSGGGRQGIASAVVALCKPGDRIGVEPLTYPSIMHIAALRGLQLVPIAVDNEGIDIAALSKAHRAKPLAAIYIQPSVHNPLGISMTPSRREALAQALGKLGLVCIEDGVFAFLSDAAPLVAYAPERVIFIASMHKRIAPGTGLGLVAAPSHLKDGIATAMRAGSWVASALSMNLGLSWIADGTAERVGRLKRADARARQALAARILANATVMADKNAFHLWLELPDRWRADTFVSAAAQRGVAISPASAFAVTPGHAPNAVRIAISAPPLRDLEHGLRTISSLAASSPHDTPIE
jgi:DNA-binding transcriptional MocR family regulator